MNPEIDLTSFRRGSSDDSNPEGHPLVSPPRRIITRYVIPTSLLAVFAAMCAYAARDALIPAISVKVVQPVLMSGPGLAEGAAETKTADEQTSNPGQKNENQMSGGKASNFASGKVLFQAPGWVEPDPFSRHVSALVPGILAKVNVREGDSIPAGTVIAELDDAEAKVALRRAQATLGLRRAELEAAQLNWDNPIKTTETLQLARAEIERLAAEKNKVEKQADLARRQSEVSSALGARGAEGTFPAEKAMLEYNAMQASIKEIDARILAQHATLQAAEQDARLRLEDRARLATSKAQIEEAEAAVAEAELRVSRCKVQAPTSGTVMKLHMVPGSMVAMDVADGSQIISMYDPTHMQVRAEVPLADAGKIQIGLPVEIRVEAMPDTVFHGELTRIVHEADVQRNSLPVKVRVLDSNPTLKPEMVARLQFMSLSMPPPAKGAGDEQSHQSNQVEAATTEAGALYIPNSIVPPGAKAAGSLWVVGPDLCAHQKVVTIGEHHRGELREISSGLQPSDKVIANNIEKLKEGIRVRIEASE